MFLIPPCPKCSGVLRLQHGGVTRCSCGFEVDTIALAVTQAAAGRMGPRREPGLESCNRCLEPGYHRIGRIDKPQRRSLWIRESPGAIELCAGREGDDAYVKITPDNPQWRDLQDVLRAARFAAEYEDSDGLTLEREAREQGRTGRTGDA